MPKENIDYSKTIIYKIVCKDIDIKDCYVGGTTDFVRRKSEHKNCTVKNTKKSNLYVYVFINQNGSWDNWEMIEIEKYDAADKLDSLKRERFWLEELKATLNKTIPSRTKEESRKEWYKANPEYNKEYIKEYRKVNEEKLNQKSKEYRKVNEEKLNQKSKEWYKANKEKIKERKNEKISCECGCVISRTRISRHKNSKFHLNFLNEQIE